MLRGNCGVVEAGRYRAERMAWYHHASAVEIDVRCGEANHLVRWDHGVLRPTDHDLDAERVLVAFGGAKAPCVALTDLWDEAIADGGFLEEWSVHERADTKRLWWLGTALTRLRGEGVQDFLYSLPAGRAERMATAVTSLAHPLLDRAAATVAAAELTPAELTSAELMPSAPSPLARHIAHAVEIRLRSAFVRSLAVHRAHARPAALVRFDVEVVPEAEPLVLGRLAGRSSWCRLVVAPNWLVEVWGRGWDVINGDLVVSVDHDGADTGSETSHIRTVRWRPHGDALMPEVTEAIVEAKAS